jgi:phosphomannomutase
MESDDSVIPHECLGIKARHGEKGKISPFLEEKIRDELQRNGKAAGKWVKRKIITDHENDWYEEEVVDPDTGEIIYKCAEPRSKHTGHGCAKPK